MEESSSQETQDPNHPLHPKKSQQVSLSDISTTTSHSYHEAMSVLLSCEYCGSLLSSNPLQCGLCSLHYCSEHNLQQCQNCDSQTFIQPSKHFKSLLESLMIKCQVCKKEYQYSAIQGHKCLIQCGKCDLKYVDGDEMPHDCVLALKEMVKQLKEKNIGSSGNCCYEQMLLKHKEIYNDIIDFQKEFSLNPLRLSPDTFKTFQLIETDQHLYYGQLNNLNLYQGFGSLYEKQLCRFYEGEFRNSLKNGNGRQYIVKGENRGHRYEGAFTDGKYQGQGKYVWNDGDSYSGSFNDGVQEGFGVFNYYVTGDRYSGYFKDNLRDGLGMHIKSSKDKQGVEIPGDTYIGEYKSDTSEGTGIFFFKDINEKYLGDWKLGIFQGNGMYYFRDGSLYMGKFQTDQKHGSGVMVDSKGLLMFKVKMERDAIKEKIII